jgi:GTP-binding protein EngB required for normal cell division
MTTELAFNKSLSEKEADRRKALLDEMYGYTEEMSDEQKSELQQLVSAYMEHRKNKQQQPLRTMLGR